MNLPNHQTGDNLASDAAGMRFQRASDLARRPELMEPPAIPIPPFAVAGRVTLLTLGPKGGKSTTAAGLIALGTADFEVACGLLTLDEALPDSLQRLARFGANLDLVFVADTLDPATLEEEVAAQGIQVLVVDHLGKLAEAAPEFGANSQGDPILWARLMSPFTRLAREADLAIVLLDQSRRSDNAYAGSVHKAGGVDLLCELHPKDGGLACTPRGRVALPPFRVDLDPTGKPQFTTTAARDPAPARQRSRLTEAHRLGVLRVLRNAEPDGLKAAQWARMVKEDLGLGTSAFYEARRALYDGGLASHASRLYHVTPTGERRLAEEAKAA